MKPMDLTGLIKGILVVIGIAMALGKLNELKRWATKEAFPETANFLSPHRAKLQGPGRMR